MPDDFILLIADRNRNVREFLRREFTSEGYRVAVARDGEEVLESLRRAEPPHVLVLDPEIQFSRMLKLGSQLPNFSRPIFFENAL